MISNIKRQFNNIRTTYHYDKDDNGDYYYDWNKYRLYSKCEYKDIYKDSQKFKLVANDHIIFGASLALALALFTVLRDILVYLYGRIKGIISDGYAMIFFSPVVLVYWVIITIPFIPIILLLILFVAVASLWSIIVELPASFANNDNVKSSWIFNSEPAKGIIALLFVGILLVTLTLII